MIIIGGGAAGMIAANFAIKNGAADVMLLEKNEKLGKKLYITGKGRCNVTNDCSVDDFIRSLPHNGRFMFSALRFLPPATLRDMLRELGCDTMVERGQRVYPISQRASDVTKALTRGMAKAQVKLGSEVDSLIIEDGAAAGVKLRSGEILRCDAVIVATGGVSYPVTGSTGDGYRFAQAAGHKVLPQNPSLVPVTLSDPWAIMLQGLSLKNVTLSLFMNDKRVYSEQGELLFTHFGISGPLTLTASCHIAGADASSVRLSLDMKPALSRETLEVRLKKDLQSNGRKQLSSIMGDYFPASMAALFPAIAGVDGTTLCSQVTAKERAQLLDTMKGIPMHFVSLRSFSEAVVTRGGVDVKDIDPSTMASKKVRGLYFAGEIIDVDGFTGGFNLHIAFSTGALAGASAATYLEN